MKTTKEPLLIGEDSPKAALFCQKISKALRDNKRLCVLICIILLIKLILMGMFSSDYQNRMFEPFIRTFLEKGFTNPYEWFYSQGQHYDFPYPPVMLLIMSLGEGLCILIPGLSLFLHNIVFKLPLLIMDCLVFRMLCKKFSDKKLRITLLYFMSPIILYATYMHGQLDIIPMTFLFIALNNLTGEQSRKKYFLSALFLSLSLLSKFHIAVVLPLIALYLYKHRGFNKSAAYCALVLLFTVLGILPFYGEGFLDGVVFNNAQSSLFSFFLSFGSVKFYPSIGAVILVFLYAMNWNFINSELLLGLCGLAFSIFLVLCVPMPGWYIWIILFVADFVIRSNGYHHAYFSYFVLNLFYIIFFVFFHRSADGAVDLYLFNTDCSFLKVQEGLLQNISFTLLSATLLYIIMLMHKFCIAGNSLYHFRDSAFLIGICGDSGTGKSTLLKYLSSMFSKNNLLQIEGDGDHKWERGNSNWQEFTHLNPQANYLYRQAKDIISLKKGRSVKRVDYDHVTGHFTGKRTFSPCRFISVCGLLVFYLPQLRNIIDLKVYTEAEEELRIVWKMERDTNSRGYTREDILGQIRSRHDDANYYIYPQKDFADIVFRYFVDNNEKKDLPGVKAMINTQIDLDRLVEVLKAAGAVFTFEFSEDFRYQIIEFRPSLNEQLNKADFGKLFAESFDRGYDILSRSFEADNSLECVQKLILVQAICSKLREEV